MLYHWLGSEADEPLTLTDFVGFSPAVEAASFAQRVWDQNFEAIYGRPPDFFEQIFGMRL